ncbi:hypothetical protein P3T76_006323 [Phytophthora citrophthora]|uniref:RxLR effector protein n=1 Tax=Phytophthora citrophthora TaxID=4793 RepID=A0AAD9GQ01_9STRA|nr:hypothetical protein P3T76_006323 [Phytophthora citrophthora]
MILQFPTEVDHLESTILGPKTMTIRLPLYVLLLLVCFTARCVDLTSSEIHAYVRNIDTQGVNGNNIQHLKGNRELVEGGTVLTNAENEERGVSFSSASKLLGRLKARINGNAGAKTEKLTGTQVKSLERGGGGSEEGPEGMASYQDKLKGSHGSHTDNDEGRERCAVQDLQTCLHFGPNLAVLLHVCRHLSRDGLDLTVSERLRLLSPTAADTSNLAAEFCEKISCSSLFLEGIRQPPLILRQFTASLDVGFVLGIAEMSDVFGAGKADAGRDESGHDQGQEDAQTHWNHFEK